jgi:hypothetical protein
MVRTGVASSEARSKRSSQSQEAAGTRRIDGAEGAGARGRVAGASEREPLLESNTATGGTEVRGGRASTSVAGGGGSDSEDEAGMGMALSVVTAMPLAGAATAGETLLRGWARRRRRSAP